MADTASQDLTRERSDPSLAERWAETEGSFSEGGKPRSTMAGWEVLSEVSRVESAFRAIGDMGEGEGNAAEDAQWAAAVAGVADLCDRTLADAYSAVQGGFEGEDYIVGYSRALYVAASIMGRAIPKLTAEEAERAIFSLSWFSLMLSDLAKKASEMSEEQQRGVTAPDS